jgi:hypothetical protein
MATREYHLRGLRVSAAHVEYAQRSGVQRAEYVVEAFRLADEGNSSATGEASCVLVGCSVNVGRIGIVVEATTRHDRRRSHMRRPVQGARRLLFTGLGCPRARVMQGVPVPASSGTRTSG